MSVDYNKIWSDKWGDMQRFGPCHLHRRRIIERMLKGLDFCSVLDVGCGEGTNLEFLNSLRASCALTGVDISKRAVDLMTEKLPGISFFCLDCQTTNLDKVFDLVTCIDVVEHLINDEAAIKNLFKMTKKYCLIATIQGSMRGFETEIGHVRNYQVGELEEKMKAAGFRIVESISWGWPFHSPLYRDLLNAGNVNKLTEGKMGFAKHLISRIIYAFFFLNSSKRGDMLFVLGLRD